MLTSGREKGPCWTVYIPPTPFSSCQFISGLFMSNKIVFSQDKPQLQWPLPDWGKLVVHSSQTIQSTHKQANDQWLFFIWFDSLRPINNLSVLKGQVFLGWTRTKLWLIFLLKDTTQWRRWGSNPRPLSLESSTLPLSHCAPKDQCTLYIMW